MYAVAHDAWKGVMHAVVTPFDADGSIDDSVRDFAQQEGETAARGRAALARAA